MTTTTARGSLTTATLRDTLRITSDILVPTLAKGPIIRRPKVVALAERFELDRRAVRRMQELRDTYGSGPLLLRTPPGRTQAIILDPEHVHRVLDGSPEPFSTASSEKRAALAHFEPKGALVTRGPERAPRRRYNEQVLDSERPQHRMAETFIAVAREEAEGILEGARRAGELNWAVFADGWFRMVRRVVFGDGARDDTKLRALIDGLRADGNWAFLKPKRRGVRRQFYARLQRHLARAEPGSLAQMMAATPASRDTAPEQQVPQWLFAFDPAGMTTFRTLALLAAHPDHAEHAREEIREQEDLPTPHLPYLRASVLESLRLWPTTPMVLRQSTRETTWAGGVMPAETGILIYAPFFHRDDEVLPYADRFAPEVWLDERRDPKAWPLIPFSGGPAICPGRHLVLLLTSTVLATIIAERQVWLKPLTRLDPRRPLPGTLDNYSLRFVFDR
jgi:cytochrome P450